jgi:hypothetical protein
MRTTRRQTIVGRWVTAWAVLLALAFLGGVIGLWRLHAVTADWWPQAVPTRTQYDGRDFSCLDGGRKRVVPASRLAGLEPRGQTIGGGVIYAPPGDELPIGILVVADGEVRACALSGGP